MPRRSQNSWESLTECCYKRAEWKHHKITTVKWSPAAHAWRKEKVHACCWKDSYTLEFMRLCCFLEWPASQTKLELEFVTHLPPPYMLLLCLGLALSHFIFRKQLEVPCNKWRIRCLNEECHLYRMLVSINRKLVRTWDESKKERSSPIE